MRSDKAEGPSPGKPLAGRYVLGRRLGAGAFGVVYEAQDLRLGGRVAVKRLLSPEPAALFRFKHEFRLLADIAHPNLARIHELFEASGDWYIAMELVDGVDCLSYVRPGSTGAEFVTTEDHDTGSPAPRPEGSGPGAPDIRRVRATLAQIVAGVRALHVANKLHRDLKPSNVLVRSDGAVRILDFGLVAEVSADGAHETVGTGVRGTPAYMAPEQAAGEPTTPASDWYAVGAILYEALTGRVPFTGGSRHVMRAKQTEAPADPRSIVRDVPDDLVDLSLRLLSVAPEGRPSGSEIAEIFETTPSIPSQPGSEPPSQGSSLEPFVGRRNHLNALEEALQASQTRRAAMVLIPGRSGMGKTALVRQFLAEKRSRQNTVVLSGRCYERESVPFKAFDSCMDQLVSFLLGLSSLDVERLMPREVHTLARLFPVLGRIEAVTRVPERDDPIPDPQEVRRRALLALRELFARLTDRFSLIVHLDDLQWGDADSVSLLLELLRPPDPPPILLLASYRSEDVDRSPFLRALLAERSRIGVMARVSELPVEPLTADEALALSQTLLAQAAAPPGLDPATIARESEGSPFFLHELVRLVTASRSGRESSAFGIVSLEELVTRRVSRLDESARRLLSVVALGGPMPGPIAWRAADLDQSEGTAALLELKRASLIWTRPAPADEEVEPSHDRVRETVVGMAPAGALEHQHSRIAEALEATGRADPERLMVHMRGAGNTMRARDYALAAAERAMTVLAFDRAARLYAAALEMSSQQKWPVRVKLGEALARAGRGREAGEAYLAALQAAPPDQGLALRRAAAEQFLVAGHMDAGLETLRSVFKEVGMSLPSTPSRAVASLIYHRTRLRLRGTRFRERDLKSVPSNDLLRIDVCWAAGLGLGGTDMIRGMDFLSRHLLLALRAGEPYRIARGLAIEALFTASGGGKSIVRSERLAAEAHALATRLSHPQALAMWALAAQGLGHHCQLRFREASELFKSTLEILRNQQGAGWELGTTQYFLVLALEQIGEMREMFSYVQSAAKEASARGDLYTESLLRLTGMTWWWLAADRPGDAEQERRQIMSRWTKQGFHLQHNWALMASIHCSLYREDHEAALRAMDDAEPELKRSQILRHETQLMYWLDLRGRVHLAAGRNSATREPLLREVEKSAERLARWDFVITKSLAFVLRAGVAAIRGHNDRATELLQEAEQLAEAGEFRLRLMAMRRRRGELIGGEAGRRLVQEADAWMTGQGFRKPEAITAILAPGF